MTEEWTFAPGEEVPEWLMGGPDRARCTVKFTAFAKVARGQDGKYVVYHQPSESVIFIDPEPGADVVLNGGNGSGIMFVEVPEPYAWSWKVQ